MLNKAVLESAPEALAKAKEFQVPGSLATKAALGITLYLHGHRETRVINMIRGGIKFCELYEHVLSATSPKAESKLQSYPRFYKPSEIFQAPSMSKLQNANIAEMLSDLKKTLSLIETQKELPPKKLVKCRDLLSTLAMPYVAQAMISMSDYKRSRKGSTW